MYLTVLLSLFLVASCLPSFEKGNFTFQEKVEFKPALEPESAAFTELKEKVLKPQCLDCHENKHADYAIEAKFQNRMRPGRPDLSKKYLTVIEGKMPQGKPKLSQEDADLIKNYILGLKTPDRGAFTAFKKRILEPYKCLNCHGFMENEEVVLKNIVPGVPESSRFYQLLVDRKMPKGENATHLTEEDLGFVRDYIIALKPAVLDEVSPEPANDGEVEGTPAGSIGQDPPAEL